MPRRNQVVMVDGQLKEFGSLPKKQQRKVERAEPKKIRRQESRKPTLPLYHR